MGRYIKYAAGSVVGLAASAVSCGIVSLIVRSLGDWMLHFAVQFESGDVRQYAQIFAQLHDAELDFPIALSVLLYCLLSIGFSMLFSKCIAKRNKLLFSVCVLLAVIAFFGSVIMMLLMTKVNGILFVRALAALIGFI